MKFIKHTIIFLLLFIVISPIDAPSTFADNKYKEIKDDHFKLQPGDIIITKGPVMWGFFGHSSIAIDDKTILQIEGPGDKPTTQSFESFKYIYASGKNDWMKVYRCTYPGAGKKAADWVKKNYENTNHRYLVTLNLNSKNFTYCTKIIYQGYKFGVSEKSVKSHGLLIISPYAIKDNFTEPYRLKLVKTY
ncbi:TPA: hypothetical protein RRM88_000390 [Staphylococcus argenteus]|uniref:lipoprotein N-acylation protein LnsA n=1 Tax=Staphylococcus argenteus TaxID=985002 RepID=UPI000504A8A9|nr:lipoprotein N-acylation protein LnsA [Staphylococcus argenteus]MBE2135148.1 hypothetical protein [Staphylococcus argenteus]MDT3006386.1 hypothetical protein [Staphylococcus argenteus]UPO21556.1 hypothetical protein M0D62_03990 [Staphylococcus argenteus]CDR20492.1 hypothetical protein ERS140248_00549 [Staphylococcus argenteus]CDR62975.1 hypothetical protein ERS154949_00288 [Staphylococcus argenteus]